jgi:hypothetical protein
MVKTDNPAKQMTKENRISLQYPLSVWSLTILLTPIVILLFLALTEEINYIKQIQYIPAFWIVGGLCSSPSLLIFILSNRFLEKFRLNHFTKKFLFALIGVSCISITFTILRGSLAAKWIISYSIVFFILSLVLKRHPSISKIVNDETKI